MTCASVLAETSGHYKFWISPGEALTCRAPTAIFRPMDFDISHLLNQWEYQPGQVVARRFKAKDGREQDPASAGFGLAADERRGAA